MDDQQLINRVKAGDTAAFSTLVRRHQQTAYAVAMSIVKREEDAQDVVQQGFLAAYTNLHGFQGKSLFSTWLCRIIINEALRSLRRRDGKLLEAWQENASEEIPTATNEALPLLRSEDRGKIIRRVFALMPAREALVLQLFYLKEQSVKETAYCTGLTTNHVKVLLSRGRTRFHALCRQQPDWPEISENL